MADLKENWKEVGKGLGFAFRDLGKTVIKSAKFGVDKATEWACDDDEKKETKEKNENK